MQISTTADIELPHVDGHGQRHAAALQFPRRRGVTGAGELLERGQLHPSIIRLRRLAFHCASWSRSAILASMESSDRAPLRRAAARSAARA